MRTAVESKLVGEWPRMLEGVLPLVRDLCIGLLRLLDSIRGVQLLVDGSQPTGRRASPPRDAKLH